MVERGEQLVDGVWAERVADLRTIEGDPHRPLVERPVVGDVGELELRAPATHRARIEQLGDEAVRGHLDSLPDAAPGDHHRRSLGRPDWPQGDRPLTAGTDSVPPRPAATMVVSVAWAMSADR